MSAPDWRDLPEKPTVCIDLDGVLNEYDGNYLDENCPPLRSGAREFLSEVARDHRIVILSARNTHRVSKWVHDNGLDEYVADVTTTKVPAIAYIDDRAINFSGNYQRVIDDLRDFEPWWRESYQMDQQLTLHPSMQRFRAHLDACKPFGAGWFNIISGPDAPNAPAKHLFARIDENFGALCEWASGCAEGDAAWVSGILRNIVQLAASALVFMQYPEICRHEAYVEQYDVVRQAMWDLHVEKSRGYGSEADPYENCRASLSLGINPLRGVLVRMRDKVIRLATWDDGRELPFESVEDNFSDIAVYAIIACVMAEEHGIG